MDEIILQLENITKSFGETEVLKGISLDIKQGEFITLLGPSGCGKTTTLRIIAGLEQPDGGKVFIEGEDVTNVRPNKRDVNTVFQNYALFPHMTVEANVGYSQKIRGVKKQDVKKQVKKILELVQLEGYEKRMPNQLSGGQGQRIAIARAVINRPKVLLLDEPLGALDLQLRHQMQIELKHLQKKLGITFIYITHDQEEALNMSDRIVIMKGGTFEQIGTPMEIYNAPKTSYVASFVGSANLLKGKIIKRDNEEITFKNSNGMGRALLKGREPKTEDVTVAIRGEDVLLEPITEDGQKCFSGTVVEKTFAGNAMHITLEMSDKARLVSFQQGMESVDVGDKVCATWDAAKAILVDVKEDMQ